MYIGDGRMDKRTQLVKDAITRLGGKARAAQIAQITGLDEQRIRFILYYGKVHGHFRVIQRGLYSNSEED